MTMDRVKKNKTILLIDPDPGTETLLQYALQGTGFSIQRLASGEEGLSALSRISPKLVISEFITKDLDGKTMLTRFMNEPRFSDLQQLPFIFYSNEEYKRIYKDELIDMGLWGWFTKPFGAHEMREVIENIFLDEEMVRKNRELRQEVKRSEYRYRDLLENANDLIFTLDSEGRFSYLNNRFTPLTNQNKSKWIGRAFLDLIAFEDRENALEHYEMAHQGKARIFEATITSKSKTKKVLSFNITPIVERGSIIGSIGIARDVTERKLMEKEILDLKNFNESIIQSMEAGLLTTDLTGRITSINTGAENIMEYKAEEVIGCYLKEILTQDQAEMILTIPQKPGSLHYSREMELSTKNGRKISIGFTSTDRVDNQNNKVGTIVSFRDISLIKQMQSEVIRMDRLASLGVLASGIAHEIKNPLAGIKALAQACDEEFTTKDPRREYLSRIVRQVNRLDSLLKTFFAYARPKPPDQRLHYLPEIMQEVFNLVKKKMSVKGIEYKEIVDDSLEPVLVDSQQIQQVFLNLILNAIEAMESGGTLSIMFSPYIKNSNDGHHTVEVDGLSFISTVISDTGEGIDADKLETIFDPFYTTKPNGLGLGLSIVYRIVKEHDGEINVTSEKNKGTSFTILLPRGR